MYLITQCQHIPQQNKKEKMIEPDTQGTFEMALVFIPIFFHIPTFPIFLALFSFIIVIPFHLPGCLTPYTLINNAYCKGTEKLQ